MPVNDLAFVAGLNGEEIIIDVCGLVAEKLRSDCNLRAIDSYSGGYKAKVTIHLEAFGLDQAIVDYGVEVDETGPGEDLENPVDLMAPDVNLDTELEVPVEADLSLVRERSSQIAPDFEIKPVEMTPEGPIGATQKRKYTRRLKALAQAQGGATGTLDE